MTETERIGKIRHYYTLAASISAIFEYNGFQSVFEKCENQIKIMFGLEKDGKQYVLSFLPLLICEIPIAYLLEVSLTALDQSHTGH